MGPLSHEVKRAGRPCSGGFTPPFSRSPPRHGGINPPLRSRDSPAPQELAEAANFCCVGWRRRSHCSVCDLAKREVAVPAYGNRCIGDEVLRVRGTTFIAAATKPVIISCAACQAIRRAGRADPREAERLQASCDVLIAGRVGIALLPAICFSRHSRFGPRRPIRLPL